MFSVVPRRGQETIASLSYAVGCRLQLRSVRFPCFGDLRCSAQGKRGSLTSQAGAAVGDSSFRCGSAGACRGSGQAPLGCFVSKPGGRSQRCPVDASNWPFSCPGEAADSLQGLQQIKGEGSELCGRYMMRSHIIRLFMKLPLCLELSIKKNRAASACRAVGRRNLDRHLHPRIRTH